MRRWADFKRFLNDILSREVERSRGEEVVAYMHYLGKRANQPKVHAKNCTADITCPCPRLHRHNTLLNIRTALANGYRTEQIHPNPANDFTVDCFLNSVRKQSDRARVEEKQADPIPRSKTNSVAAMIELVAGTEPGTNFALTNWRNAAFFRLLSYTGGRAVDVLSLQWQDIKHFPATDTIEVLIRAGKTTSMRKPHRVVINTRQEGRLAQSLVTLGKETAKRCMMDGYVFRPFTGGKTNPSAPLSRAQLATLIKEKFGKNFTTHSFRVAKAIGLKQLGLTWLEVAVGLGCSPPTAERYARNAEKYDEIMY